MHLIADITAVHITDQIRRIALGVLTCAASMGNQACTPMYPLTVSPNTPTAKLRYVNSLSDGNSTMLEFRDVSACPQKPKRFRVASTTSPSWISNGDPEISTVAMARSSSEPQVFTKERIIPAGRPVVYVLTAVKAASPGVLGYSCEYAGAFFPQPDHEYKLDFKTQSRGFGQAPLCEASVSELKAPKFGEIQLVGMPPQEVPLMSAHPVNLRIAESNACLLVNGAK